MFVLFAVEFGEGVQCTKDLVGQFDVFRKEKLVFEKLLLI